MKKCNICGVETQDTELSPTLDCGGDCLSCMAEAGDPASLESMYHFLKEENRDLRIQRDELLAALKDLLAPHEGECRFDHNGYCQEHFLDHSMDGCRVATARDAIARAEKAK